ncbi:hypothetical protein D3C81_1414890 [compost metagenome]
MHIGWAAVIEQPGLGRHRVGDNRQAAGAGEQAGGTPVDFQHLAFGAVDGDRVTDLVWPRGVQDDAAEHVGQRALQRQADDDGHHPGRRQQALHRQLHHIACGSDHGCQEDQRTQHILQQPPAMAAAGHQQQTEHHRYRARAKQPPADRQHRGYEVARDIVGPGWRLQRAHASCNQYRTEQQEQHQPRADAPGAALDWDDLPEHEVEQDQGSAEQQRG